MMRLLQMMMMLMMKMLVVAWTDDGDDYNYNDAMKTHSMTIDHTATKTAQNQLTTFFFSLWKSFDVSGLT